MAQVHRGRFEVVLFGALLVRLLVTGPLSAQAPFSADNEKGFAPNATFATNGIDNVNVFSGNLVVTIPLGPDYPIGAGFSHQLRLVYNSKIWTSRLACNTDPGTNLYGAYVTGSPRHRHAPRSRAGGHGDGDPGRPLSPETFLTLNRRDS